MAKEEKGKPGGLICPIAWAGGVQFSPCIMEQCAWWVTVGKWADKPVDKKPKWIITGGRCVMLALDDIASELANMRPF